MGPSIQWIEMNLERLIHNKRWFDKAKGAICEVKIYDYLCLKAVSDLKVFLLIVQVSEGQATNFYAVPVETVRYSTGNGLSDSGGEEWRINESSYSQCFNEELLRLFAGNIDSATTAMGNCLVFEKQSVETKRFNRIDIIRPFKQNESTNCLNYLEAGGKKYILKLYKKLDEENHENFVYQIINGEDEEIPTIIGNCFYKDLQSCRLFPVGMVMEFCEGNSIDRELGRNLKNLWNEPAVIIDDTITQDRMIAENVEPLRPLLEEIAQRLIRFHRIINDKLNSAENSKTFNLHHYLQCCRSRLERVAGFINQSGQTESNDLHWVIKILEQYRETVFADSLYAGQLNFLPGFCHGDLHLSNLLYHYTNGDHHHIKIVDFAPRGIDITSKHFLTESPLQDIVAIQRGLEYLCFEEANLEISKRLHISERTATKCQFLSLLSNTSGRDRLSLTAVDNFLCVRRINRITQCWNDLVFKTIWKNYFEDRSIYKYYIRTGAISTILKMHKIFYVSRLLKELAYNDDHQRDDLKYVDYYYLAKQSLQPGDKLLPFPVKLEAV